MPLTPLESYRALRESGRLQPDAAQARAASVLDALSRKLKTYRPHTRGLFGFALGANGETPKGLYIHGDVGRGKSLLMDIFFDAAPVTKKRRIHFNAFMAETHQRIHEWRQMSARERARRPEFVKDAGEDPIAPVAKRISLEATLLCFDEFQVNDVADAMILGRLFERLFAFGVVVVLTSNIPPHRLYEGGLNRALFLPFIAMIEEHMRVLELNAARDFRLDRMNGMKVYIAPLGPDADRAMDEAWRALSGTANGSPLTLEILQRSFTVPQAANGVARFSFKALCGQPLAAADYLALARSFHTVMIDRIPRMKPEDRNEARRFTVLIDTLYDEKVRLVCSAETEPSGLYAEGDNAEAFRRVVSRLMEMQSAEYFDGTTETRLSAVAS
jgi:cell division protein ZapE